MANLSELLAAHCDLIDQADGLIHQAGALAQGRGTWKRLVFARGAGWTGADVERELKRVGIRVCGRLAHPATADCPAGRLSLLVPAEQSRWAEYVLMRAGAPLVSDVMIDPRNANWAAGHDGPVEAWSGKPSRGASGAAAVQKAVGPVANGKQGGLRRLWRWLRDGE